MERFGTDGIRFLYQGESSPFFAYRLGRAIGLLPQAEIILIGRDNRPSGKALVSALISGLHAMGMVALDLGEISTPAFAYCLTAHHAQYGVMVTASHNPAAYNGFKVYNGDGHKIGADLQRQIEAHLDFSGAMMGSSYPNETISPKPYLEALESAFAGKVYQGRYLFDFANGVSATLAKEVLSCHLAHPHFCFDGNGSLVNEGCGVTHPEATLGRCHEFDLTFLFDGDGDRVNAYLPDGRCLDGASFLFGFGRLQKQPIVSTVMATYALETELAKVGVQTYFEAVGDAGVLEKMEAVGANLGGEPSGHLIFRDFSPSGDGLYAALRLIDLRENHPEDYEKLIAFRPYPFVSKNLLFPNEEAARLALENPAFLQTLEEIRACFDGRIVVRPSGTEPVVRLFIESPNEEEHDTILGRLIAALGQ